ncbi:unnamed protein product [Auanema sp. JU1783]|nr:unnamed protein product [Auanema sp. JU1783]
MGCFAVFILSLLATLLFATAQLEANFQLQAGKPCESAYHCWRTEPIDANGQPISLLSSRGKRLEIGSNSKSRGGRCRCIEGVCQLYHLATESFFACEEF